MNSVVGYLIDSLQKAQIWSNLNLIIVSDHGMTNLNENECIIMKDHLNLNLIDQEKTHCAEIGNIYPKSNEDVNIFAI